VSAHGQQTYALRRHPPDGGIDDSPGVRWRPE
jgi:hypothetical protein